MKRYCEKCRDYHDENEMCPQYKEQLKKHPEWLGQAANFATVAGQYHLISSQALDKGASLVNKICGTNLSYEGTHQLARDVQVFAKLNSDSFRNSGVFSNAQIAKETFENSSEGFKRYLRGRLNGTGQEVDWLRWKNGKLSSLFSKSSLPDGNTVGYDGITVNRFTGKVIERTTVKAAEGSSGLYTNAKDVVEAIQKGTLNTNDTVFGIKGMDAELNKAFDKAIAEAQNNKTLQSQLKAAKDNLKVIESGDKSTIQKSTERLTEKIKNGQASSTVTLEQLGKKMAQGAVIGAAISLTVSSITNFIRYKNGEITEKEAFRDVGQDAVKGALVGGAMAGITLFLPGGAIGFVAGMAIGVYVGSVCTNLLDEVFGKGAYEQILHASGYVSGTAHNVTDMLGRFQENIENIDSNLKKASYVRTTTKKLLYENDNCDQAISAWMEDK